MTIDELIERLEAYRDEIGGDAEVRLMIQSNWPFECDIFGLASGEEINEAADENGPPDDGDAEADRVLYVCEGTQLGYGRSAPGRSRPEAETPAWASRRVAVHRDSI